MQNHMAMRIGVLLGLVLPVAGVSAQDTYGVGAKPLPSYNQIKTALQKGQQLSVVLHLNECSPRVPDQHGGVPIRDFQILKDHIAFSSTHQTLDDEGNIIYEFNRYKISSRTPSANANVEMSSYVWKAGDTQAKLAETFSCETDGGGADVTG
jgi:hypothetical protein